MAEDRERGTCAPGELTLPNPDVPAPLVPEVIEGYGSSVLPRSPVGSLPVPRITEEVLDRSSRAFLRSYASSKNLADAGKRWAEARKARPYANDDSAASAASRKLQEIRRRLTESGHAEFFWESLGLSAAQIAETLREGMKAVRREPVSVRRDKVVLADGREKVVRDDTVEIVEVGEDHRSRIESAVRAASLRGELYASRRSETSAEEAGRPTINVVIRSFAVNTQFNQPAALPAENPKEE